jgi:hypothetical protein
MFSLNSCAQNEPTFYIDVSNYPKGNVVVMLDLGETHFDTVTIDNNGCGRLKYSESFKMYGKAFKFIHKDSLNNFIELREWKNNLVDIRDNEILYQHGLFMGRNSTNFLIFIVGTKEFLTSEFDIDDPKLDEQMKSFE